MSLRSDDLNEKDVFWPGGMWRSRFCAKYNLKCKKNHKTRFSKRAYKSQLVSALVFNRAIRYMFKIRSGVGKIRNVDESMSYLYNSAARSWTV